MVTVCITMATVRSAARVTHQGLMTGDRGMLSHHECQTATTEFKIDDLMTLH